MSDQADAAQLIDLRHLGRARMVGAWLVGDVLVDCGPGSCLATLLDALGDKTPRALALTHIHLDHAGAAGALAQRFPDMEVWVHELGAPHLVDPTKLLASATRLYGEDMERLWGDVVPVPADRITALSGGEVIDPFRVIYTPGHAAHHVTYVLGERDCAFTGDVTGVRIGGRYVLPPTPPPEVDLVAWRRSLDALVELAPRRIALTHFGRYTDVAGHLESMLDQLDEVERLASDLSEPMFAATMLARVRETTDEKTAAAYAQVSPLSQSYQGLLRYLRTRPES
jgi:glyoxylase-like metal-dependent hydrolase (beta-lactamase superfamily II)